MLRYVMSLSFSFRYLASNYDIFLQDLYSGTSDSLLHSILSDHDDYKKLIEKQKKEIDELRAENEQLKLELQKSSYPTSDMGARYWTPLEHSRFLDAISIYGDRNFHHIAQYIGNKSTSQVRSHAQKYFQRISKLKNSSYYPSYANACSIKVPSGDTCKKSKASMSTNHPFDTEGEQRILDFIQDQYFDEDMDQ